MQVLQSDVSTNVVAVVNDMATWRSAFESIEDEKGNAKRAFLPVSR